MDKDFIYRQTLVWLEHEKINYWCTCGRPECKAILLRERLAQSLTEHLVNNADQVDKAKDIHHNRYCTCTAIW